MNTSLIIYGSLYGSAKRYAEKLADLTGVVAVDYKDVENINDYDRIIYFGALYAGGVTGLKKTAGKMSPEQELIIATIGLANPNDRQNTNNIKQNIKKQIPENFYDESKIFHLRGAIDYKKLGLKHRVMMSMLVSKVKKLPESEQNAETRAMIATYDKQVDFVDFSSLKPIVKIATMNKMIAICGLNCEKCDAFIATKNNDQALREKTAKLWSELNKTSILPEQINCEGCRMDGAKTVFCSNLCEIRKCAVSKNYETCGDCPEMEHCPKVGAIHSNNAEAKKNLAVVRLKYFGLLLIMFLITSCISNTKSLKDLKSEYVTMNDSVNIHYKTYGDGDKTICFVHGFGCDLNTWEKQFEGLRNDDNFRLVFIDLPGYGESSKPHVDYNLDFFAQAVNKVLDENRVGAVTLVGHSLGTPVCRHTLMNYHKGDLVDVDGVYCFYDGTETPEYIEAIQQFGHAFDGPDCEEVITGFVISLAGPDTPQEITDYAMSVMPKTPQYVASSTMQNLVERQWWPETPFEGKAMVVCTQNSGLDPDNRHKMEHLYPNLDYTELTTCGHFIQMEQAERFNEKLKQFVLKETPMNTELKPFDVQKDFADNGFTFFTKNLVLCSGDTTENNAMTIGWGSIGNYIGHDRPTVTVYVAPARYTWEFMERHGRFTIMEFEDPEVWKYMGRNSGRDGDKAAALGLHTAYTKNGTPYYEEAKLVIECEIMTSWHQNENDFRNATPKDWYADFDAGIHTVYIGEVIGAWRR